MSIENEDIHGHLQELSGSDFEIAEGQPDVTGWEVKDEEGTYIGEVEEILFDPRSQKVRYLVVNLDDNELDVEDDQSVLIPIGLVDLHESEDEVVLSAFHAQRIAALPAYLDDEEVTAEQEIQIRSVFEDHGAANTDNLPTVYDKDQFYNHGHFDDTRFYYRRGQSGDDSLEDDERDRPVL